MNKIIIHEPFVRKEVDKTRLIALIERPNEEPFELFYEVDDEYAKYLCYERSDPFLLGIVEYAMYTGCNIECIAPVSERLYYQLTRYYIPILAKNISYFNEIAIKCKLIGKDYKNASAVGTGFSGGVDSFYTVLKHTNPYETSHRLTHLVFANCGALDYVGGETSKNIFRRKLNFFKPIFEELKLPVVAIHTNYMEFSEKIPIPAHNCGAVKTGSCIHALAKLFGIYYFSAGLELERFRFSETDTAFYDMFSLYAISVNTLTFHSTGLEVNRVQKLDYIADTKLVQKSLTVCGDLNCNHCNKCIRTMMELYAMDKLDNFTAVFDITDFKRNLAKRIGRNLADKVEIEDGFNKEFFDIIKKNGIKIPRMAYIFCIIYFLKKKLNKSKLLRKFYYLFNIDTILYDGQEVKLTRKY